MSWFKRTTGKQAPMPGETHPHPAEELSADMTAWASSEWLAKDANGPRRIADMTKAAKRAEGLLVGSQLVPPAYYRDRLTHLAVDILVQIGKPARDTASGHHTLAIVVALLASGHVAIPPTYAVTDAEREELCALTMREVVAQVGASLAHLTSSNQVHAIYDLRDGRRGWSQ